MAKKEWKAPHLIELSLRSTNTVGFPTPPERTEMTTTTYTFTTPTFGFVMTMKQMVTTVPYAPS